MTSNLKCEIYQKSISQFSFIQLKNLRNRELTASHLESVINITKEGLVDSTSQKKFVDKFWSLFSIDGCFCETFRKQRMELLDRSRIISGKSGGIVFVRDYNNEIIAVLKKTFKPLPDPYRNISIRIYKSKGDYMNNVNRGENLDSRIMSVASDNFTNQSIVSLLLTVAINNLPENVNNCYNSRAKKSIVNQIDAFICKNYGYSLMDYADQGTLLDFINSFNGTDADFDYTLTEGIKDICSVFFALNNNNDRLAFLHSDLKATNVFVKSSSERPRFLLADFDKSSITWKNKVRFHYKGTIPTLTTLVSRLYSESFPLRTYRGEEVYSLYQHMIQKNISLRTLGRYIGLHTMSSPFAFYQSYDIYTFMVSIALTDKVSKSLDNLPKFKRLFESLWVNMKDYNKIRSIITEVSDMTLNQKKYYQSISIIAGLLSNANVFLRKDLTGFYETLGFYSQCNILDSSEKESIPESISKSNM